MVFLKIFRSPVFACFSWSWTYMGAFFNVQAVMPNFLALICDHFAVAVLSFLAASWTEMFENFLYLFNLLGDDFTIGRHGIDLYFPSLVALNLLSSYFINSLFIVILANKVVKVIFLSSFFKSEKLDSQNFGFLYVSFWNKSKFIKKKLTFSETKRVGLSKNIQIEVFYTANFFLCTI